MSENGTAKAYLDLAARAGVRGFGLVEPNPMVGAVIAKGGQVIGVGHHRRYGGLHAEREAIANCRESGREPRGATLYCTLEPCCHHGKQPPCTEAVIEAGITRVVIARRDPHELSRGGWEALEAAGIGVELCADSVNAVRLSDPFIHRVKTGRPWVIAKWAQTLDGRIATRTGASRWISGPGCRRRVHRLRAKVDAVMVGVGTAIADDPMLDARDCLHARRVAKRVVLDTNARIDPESKLVRTAGAIPTLVCTAVPERATGLGACEIVRAPTYGEHLDLEGTLDLLARDYGVASVLVEAGPRVLGALIQADLIDEAVVHLAPGVIGDELARPVAEGREVPGLDGMRRYALLRTRRVGDDIELHYRRDHSAAL